MGGKIYKAQLISLPNIGWKTGAKFLSKSIRVEIAIT